MTDFEGTEPQPLKEINIKQNLKPNLEGKDFSDRPNPTDQIWESNPTAGEETTGKLNKIIEGIMKNNSDKKENNNSFDKTGFIGRDGNTYATPEALAAADEAWSRRNLGFIGRDGRTYETPEALAAADEEWMQKHNKYKGMDGKDYSTAEELAAADKAYLSGQKQ